MKLSEFHGFGASVRWRVTRDGVEVELCGIERTLGFPALVARVWGAYAKEINTAAREFGVPAHLIVATICIQSGGDPDTIKIEPGFLSDAQTPRKIRVGLMQTLLSTARYATRHPVDREWLRTAGQSIHAGTAYIKEQARVTHLDPPLVAAAYTAGGLFVEDPPTNRWRLREPFAKRGPQIDTFVRLFNDAVFVLARHPIAPEVGLEPLLEQAAVTAPRSPDALGADACARRVAIEFASGTNPDALTPYSLQVLGDILRRARQHRVLVSGTARSPEAQARLMYEALEQHGPEAQRTRYGQAGVTVIEAYARLKSAGRSAARTIAEMAAAIRAVGPANVSRHVCDSAVLNVFDVAPTSVVDARRFEAAVRGDERVLRFLRPPEDPGFHLEIPQMSA